MDLYELVVEGVDVRAGGLGPGVGSEDVNDGMAEDVAAGFVMLCWFLGYGGLLI